MKIMRFAEYEDYIYLNTHFTREVARDIARKCWNHNLSKEDALNYARKYEVRRQDNG